MKTSALIIAILIFLSFQLEGQKVLLEFNPPEGLVMETEFISKSIIDQEVMGIQQSIEMEMNMELTGRVISGEYDNITIRYQYKRLSVSSNSAMFSLELNSEGDAADPGNRVLHALTGKEFTSVHDRSGGIKEISGVEELIESVMEETLEGGPESQAYSQTLRETFGEESFEQNLMQLSASYPEYKVGVGDTWVFENSTSMPQMNVNMVNKATVKSVSDKSVVVQINTLIQSPENNSMDIQGMEGTMTLEGSQLSEIKIDPKTGIVRDGVVTQEIQGELIINMNEEGSDDLVIPMLIKSKIEMTTSVSGQN